LILLISISTAQVVGVIHMNHYYFHKNFCWSMSQILVKEDKNLWIIIQSSFPAVRRSTVQCICETNKKDVSCDLYFFLLVLYYRVRISKKKKKIRIMSESQGTCPWCLVWHFVTHCRSPCLDESPAETAALSITFPIKF
jgi:hypothetical protein